MTFTSGQAKACTGGLGNAKPDVSMMMCSRAGLRAKIALIAARKSSATVQQTHPLASSVTSSSRQVGIPQPSIIPRSMPRLPNSLIRSASRRPPLCSSRCRIRLVLPAPRKPVTTVAGSLAVTTVSLAGSPARGRRRCSADEGVVPKLTVSRNQRPKQFLKGRAALCGRNFSAGLTTYRTSGWSLRPEDFRRMRVAAQNCVCSRTAPIETGPRCGL